MAATSGCVHSLPDTARTARRPHHRALPRMSRLLLVLVCLVLGADLVFQHPVANARGEVRFRDMLKYKI
jgi:hypothetical protein